jgi:phosphoenolpyruvate synthase/pyruvate phosphate dikinase
VTVRVRVGMDRILWLDECAGDHAPVVGGKAAGLGSLLREGLQVPPGFVVTTEAYRRFVRTRGLEREIDRALEGATSPDAQAEASRRLRSLFEGADPDDGLAREIRLAYDRLGPGEPVAVRSSATAEDTAEASFAGQQDTYLWIRGAEAVVRSVVRCWGSLFTPQAIAYRARFGIPAAEVAMGVVIQRMVAAEAAGVMLTLDPLTGDRSQITIEASFGLGLAVVGGEVTPDRYAVDKVTFELRSREIAPKPIAYRFDPGAGEVRACEVPPDEQQLPALSDPEVTAVASLGKRVERALGAPQDIEWAVGPGPGGPREVFLLQTRPETVWSRRDVRPLSSPEEPILSRMLKAMSVPMRLDGGPPNLGDRG